MALSKYTMACIHTNVSASLKISQAFPAYFGRCFSFCRYHRGIYISLTYLSNISQTYLSNMSSSVFRHLHPFQIVFFQLGSYVFKVPMVFSCLVRSLQYLDGSVFIHQVRVLSWLLLQLKL